MFGFNSPPPLPRVRPEPAPDPVDDEASAETLDPAGIMSATEGTVPLSFLQDFMRALKKPGGPTTLTPPRVGGTNSAGVWTGLGASGLGRLPKSSSCMRRFKADDIKNHQVMTPIEKECKLGLKLVP